MSSDDRSARFASRFDQGPVARRVMSTAIRVMTDPRRRAAMRFLREASRKLRGGPHEVHYFHQVDDPYSHLAAQAIAPLAARYDVKIFPHLTSPTVGANIPEPELLATLSRRDALAVAPHYGLDFPVASVPPGSDLVQTGEQVLAAALQTSDSAAFAARAVSVGTALWSGDKAAMESLAQELGSSNSDATATCLAEGHALREKHGHYSGAMFYYAGEWYWGVDRLHHLEHRLIALATSRDDTTLCFDRPNIPMEPVPRAGEMTLEIYPSLRSPYTAIGFEPALRLVEHTGVAHIVRPVLPMVMRGVPVTPSKGFYIMSDAVREGETLGMPFGRMVDPIGEPVRRGYSLWPWASERGRGDELLAAFLRGAFSEAIDTGSDAGLQRVVENAGLAWNEAREHLGSQDWEEKLEVNRLAMIEELGQWGVPSFRLRGPEGEPDLATWGQDRLWLIAREIARRGAQ